MILEHQLQRERFEMKQRRDKLELEVRLVMLEVELYN